MIKGMNRKRLALVELSTNKPIFLTRGLYYIFFRHGNVYCCNDAEGFDARYAFKMDSAVGAVLLNEAEEIENVLGQG